MAPAARSHAMAASQPPPTASRPYHIRAVDPFSAGEWNDLIGGRPSRTAFHSEAWARLLHECYGHTPFYLAAMDGHRLMAALPLMEVDSPLTGRRAVALPFSDECAPLSGDDAAVSTLFAHALELGRERNWQHLEIRGEIPGYESSASRADLLGHTLDLSSGLTALYAGLDSSVRRAIRKAEKHGVCTTRVTSLEAMRDYYALHCLTRRKHGVPPQPFSFFRGIVQHLFEAGHGFIMEARHSGRLVAAAVFLHHGDTAIYKFGASHPAHLGLRANDLVMWRAIQWLAEQGFTRFSMGRTAMSNNGLRRFKRGFGTTEVPIRYYRYNLRRAEFVTVSEEKETWVNRVCRLAPLPLFKMLGRVAYRHLD